MKNVCDVLLEGKILLFCLLYFLSKTLFACCVLSVVAYSFAHPLRNFMTRTKKFGWFCGLDVPRRVRGLGARMEIEAVALEISCAFGISFGRLGERAINSTGSQPRGRTESRSSGSGILLCVVLAFVAWVAVSLTSLVCGLGSGVEVRAAALKSSIVLWVVIFGHLADIVSGLV